MTEHMTTTELDLRTLRQSLERMDVDAALRVLDGLPRKARPAIPHSLTLDNLPAVHMRQLRWETRMTQPKLAEAMVGLGFTNWTPGTVAEVQRFARRLRLDEIAGLAHIFGLTVPDMLRVPKRVGLEFGDQTLDHDDATRMTGGQVSWS